MKKVAGSFYLLLFCLAAIAQHRPFSDIYSYIENTDVFELNQVDGHTICIPCKDVPQALKAGIQHENILSLNGTWKFYFSPTPDASPKGFFEKGFNDKNWQNISVPSNWEMQGFGDPLFRNVPQPFRSNPPFVPHEYNPTGSYRKSFTLPGAWKGKHVYLRLEKTASASFVWINGREVGYNEGAQEPAEYDVTGFLIPGRNTLAVQVMKYSDGVYLEDQDYWRLAGIFDDVWLCARQDVHIFDWQATTDLDDNYENANLKLEVTTKNCTSTARNGYAVRVSLFDSNKNPVQTLTSPLFQAKADTTTIMRLSALVRNPLKWTAETPNLYHLTFELINAVGKTEEVVAGRIGFKETEIRHQVFYLNGKAIKLNGINSHMQHPEMGHAMNEQTIRKDFEILKRFNFNCVRTSHYPPAARYLELADEYGLYIIDETGDESHATEYLSSNGAWEPMYRERARRMVLRDRNHPCVLFWSAGNESGEGPNICSVIREGRKYDSSRYWMYGGNAFSHACEEIIGPRYPTPFDLIMKVAMVPESTDSRPSFLDEYLSLAGNGGGGFEEYWETFYRYPRLMGGALWDFVSPGLREPVRRLTDASRNQIPAHLMGRARIVPGHDGNGLDLNGHDQWVEIYQDRSLELSGNKLSLSLWIFPRTLMNKGGTILTKGNHQFGLRQVGNDSIEFYLYTSKNHSLRGALPSNWQGNWHHVAAIYDGKNIGIYVDRKKLAEKRVEGNIRNFPFPVNIGKNAETDGQSTTNYLCDAILDQAAVFASDIPVADLFQSSPDLKAKANLWLDFENEAYEGEFFSYGIGARTYGCIWPDRRPEPEMYQFKKTVQPVTVQWSDSGKYEIEIRNRLYFKSAADIDKKWRLEENGTCIDSGRIDVELPAQSVRSVKLPLMKPSLKPGARYILTITHCLKEETMWAPKGFEVAWDQLDLPWRVPGKAEIKSPGNFVDIAENETQLVVTGENVSYGFDKALGRLVSFNVKGEELLKDGPVLNAWRAPLANELDDWNFGGSQVFPVSEGYGRMIATAWYSSGLDNLRRLPEHFDVERRQDRVIVSTKELLVPVNNSGAGFESSMVYNIFPSGEIVLRHVVDPHGRMPMWLPRLGTQWILSDKLQQVHWFGHGPQENYPDRKSGYKIGQYRSSVDELFEPYLKPQDCGLRTDNTYVRLVSREGIGLEFSAREPFNFNCYNYTTDNLTKAKYTYQLKKSDGVTFNFDYRTSGVGCTAIGVLNKYQVLPQEVSFETRIMPLY